MKDKELSAGYDHVLKYTSLFGGVQALNLLMGLVRGKLVAVLLGPSGMGLASLFNSTVNFVSGATNLGLPLSSVRHFSEIFDRGSEADIRHFVAVVRAWAILTALFGMAVCMAFGSTLGNMTFSWGNHTLHFVLLAPAVALLALLGGETAILKGARLLRSLAMAQVETALASILIAVPIYWAFGYKGIVAVIVLTAAANLAVTAFYSLRLYPLRISDFRRLIADGAPMLRLGVAFVLAAMLTSGAEMAVRSYLNVEADLDIVGLYNAGYVLTITYAGLMFSAMETDYFPRLSAVNADNAAVRTMANRQIEVSLLVSSPILACFVVALPVAVPLLYSGKFAAVVPMAQVAALSMYVKAVSLPVLYITLAKGHSRSFLMTEAVYNVALVALVVAGYRRLGLVGTGVALVSAHLIELAAAAVYTRLRYGFSFSSSVVRYSLIFLPLGAAAYAASLWLDGWRYWAAGLSVSALSLAFSLHILRRKTSLWARLKEKFAGRWA